MNRLVRKYGLWAVLLTGLLTAGCLVSGTFVIVEDIDFDFTADTGQYWYPVDLNGNDDWEDHKDDIDFIDALGFSFDINNTTGAACEMNVWFVATTDPVDMDNPPTYGTFPPAGAVQVITGLIVPVGASSVSYQESLGHISNLEAFKAIVKTGRFDYLGTSCGGTQDDLFIVTNGKIIVTISASST
jgi:hypothetical protein